MGVNVNVVGLISFQQHLDSPFGGVRLWHTCRSSIVAVDSSSKSRYIPVYASSKSLDKLRIAPDGNSQLMCLLIVALSCLGRASDLHRTHTQKAHEST
jgi:hypothetical protein